MKIQADKTYCTREGNKVVIYKTGLPGTYSVHGAIYDSNTDEWIVESWTENGYYRENYPTCENDIVAIWKSDPPDFDRTLLPAWANAAIAMDLNGQWFCYSATPKIRGDRWSIVHTDIDVAERIPPSFVPDWKGNWRNSLVVLHGPRRAKKSNPDPR